MDELPWQAGAQYAVYPELLDLARQGRHAAPDVGRVGDEVGSGVFEEGLVVGQRQGSLASVLALTREIVVRSGVVRFDSQRRQQAFARIRDLSRRLFGQREIDQRVDVSRVDRQRRM